MLSIGIWYQPYTVIPTLLHDEFGALGHLLSQMMWLCHGWGWQPPQTASHIHIRHIKSVWAHWYAVHWHTVVSLYCFTHSNRLRFWGSGSLVVVESPPHPRCCPCQPCVCSCHAGIINYTCIITLFLFVLTSWPSLFWYCRPCCSGIIDLVALVLPVSAA